MNVTASDELRPEKTKNAAASDEVQIEKTIDAAAPDEVQIEKTMDAAASGELQPEKTMNAAASGQVQTEKTIDVTALGELLVDMTETGISPAGNPMLEANPGGAPCNVLAMVSRLGRKTAFIGKVGDDRFGRMLKNAVEACGIGSEGIVMSPSVHTTLAFVHNKADGDREFSFYRNPGADMTLTKDEVNEELIRKTKIFHFGTLSSTDEPAREATRYALELAKEAGCLISFDPNLREPLWKDLKDAKAEMEYGMLRCHMLKISDNELQFYTGIEDLDEAVEVLRHRFSIPLVCLTLGTGGSKIWWGDTAAQAPAILQKNTIDTTGAGDCFWGCMLHCILKKLEDDGTQADISTDVAAVGSSCDQTEKSFVSEQSDKMKRSAGKRQTEEYSDSQNELNGRCSSLQNELAGRCSSLQNELTDRCSLLQNELAAILRFANAAASIITTRKGALKMMPERAEIEALQAEIGVVEALRAEIEVVEAPQEEQIG